MKIKLLITAISFWVINLTAQTIDYNTEKGYVAEGYDVVSYFDNQIMKGKNEFKTTHDGVNYRFSTEDNLKTFNENPSKYVPQYGGYCAYAIGAKASKVGINPETYEIRDGKLYLFYNSWGYQYIEKMER